MRPDTDNHDTNNEATSPVGLVDPLLASPPGPVPGGGEADLFQQDRTLVDEALDQCLSPREGCPDRLLEAMRYAVLGPGKRLRPRLVLLAARACGGDPPAAMPAACGVEIIHAYSLVHDDLPAMDDDDLRRGRPTVHKQFEEATAILAGDALLALALEIVVTQTKPAEVAARCTAELARAAGPAALVGGQSDDLAAAGNTLDHLRAIHRRKTGAMITVSLRLGGIVSGADDEQLACLTSYGEAIGLAFQVTDDLLDVAGDESAVGKRVGKDQQRGKLTYPGLMGVEPSRVYAAELIEGALDALEPLGVEAEPLREVARQILGRTH